MDLIDALVEDHAAVRALRGMAGRTYGLELGRVTSREDPADMGRIKATTAAKGAATDTDWLYRFSLPGLSYPVPSLGQTVIIAYEGGNTHKGYYWPLQNRANPAWNKDGLKLEVGQSTLEVEGDRVELTTGGVNVKIASNAVEVSGATLVTVDGPVVIEGPLNVRGLLTVNGTKVALEGAKDNAGHTIVDSGQ